MLRRSQKRLPDKPVEYPAGLFVNTEKGYFYIASPTKRFRVLNRRILASWSPQRVIETSEAAVANYRIVAKLKYRNGSLIYNFADAKLYLISEGKRRHITNPDVLDRLNLDKRHAIRVSQVEVNLHEEGASLN